MDTRSEEAEREAETLKRMVEGVGEESEETENMEIRDISPACEDIIFGTEEDLSIHVTGTEDTDGGGWARVLGGSTYR